MPTTPRGIEYPVTTDSVRLAYYYERVAVTADAAIVAADPQAWYSQATVTQSTVGAADTDMTGLALTVPSRTGYVYGVACGFGASQTVAPGISGSSIVVATVKVGSTAAGLNPGEYSTFHASGYFVGTGASMAVKVVFSTTAGVLTTNVGPALPIRLLVWQAGRV